MHLSENKSLWKRLLRDRGLNNEVTLTIMLFSLLEPLIVAPILSKQIIIRKIKHKYHYMFF